MAESVETMRRTHKKNLNRWHSCGKMIPYSPGNVASMRAGVIINAKSGTVQTMQPDETGRKVTSILQSHGWQSEFRLWDGASLESQVTSLLDNGAEVIMVGGGDGTVSAVAELAHQRGFPIAVLPLGTHNHFAKDIGMPSSLDESLHSFATAKVREVDLGEVNGRIFLNNSSIGAYPRAVEARSQLQKKVPLKKWMAMLIATLNTFARHPLVHVRIKLPDRVHVRSTPFVFIGNNEYVIDLFSIKLRSCLNAGTLCIYTARCSGISCLLRLFFLSLFNRLEGSRDFETFLADQVELIPHKKHLKVSKDGEVITLESPLKYRVLKRALKVLAPIEQEKFATP